MEGRAVRSSVRWRIGLEVRFVLPVAVKTVRSDRTTLPVRDALCPGRSSSLCRLLLGLELREGLLLSMAHNEASQGRFSACGAVTASDFGRVGGRVVGRSGDVVSAGRRGAQPLLGSIKGVDEREEREEGVVGPNDRSEIVDTCHAGRNRGKPFSYRAAFPRQP
jgi:hypothetical protein